MATASSMLRSRRCSLAARPTSNAYAGKPYWVFSRANGNTPTSVVAEMKARGLRRAWLVGDGKLAAAFRAERLITEQIVSVVPVLLGRGVPMFDGPAGEETLRLK